MSMETRERPVPVVIVGAGPVGLWLAAELRLAGVEVVVLERLAEPASQAKSLTLHPRTLELFAMRGSADRLVAEGTRIPSSHYALLSSRLDFTGLETRFPFVLFLPQSRTEELLAERANELGAAVRRSHTVCAVRQFEEFVEVDADTPDGPTTLRARWVVGCDGPGSTVRRSAGIAFAGSPTTMTAAVADVRLADPPQAPTLTVNGPDGALFLAALGDGLYRVSAIDPMAADVDKNKPLTFEELRESMIRVAGTDFGMHDPRYLARFGDATLQAERYRSGRVLLAGDSAHLHMPLGGQGLNLGLQDATNLGWKLAAVLNGQAGEDLLDSYHDERHPVGRQVLHGTLAQTALVSARTPAGQALREQFDEMIATLPSVNQALAVQVSGIGVGYPQAADADPLLGRRMPDLGLHGSPVRSVFGLLHQARFVLLDLTGEGRPADGVVDIARARAFDTDRPEWQDVRAVLVRPDGHIAWIARRSVVDDDHHPALSRWLNTLPSGRRTPGGPVPSPRGRQSPAHH